MASISDKNSLNMTKGNIPLLMLRFALPILAGNLFQQLYNLVDTWTVGNFVSNEAFSAVGTVTPIINMLIGALFGFSTGSSVLISRYFGAGNDKGVQDSVHTASFLALLLSLLFTILGIFGAPLMLNFMNLEPAVYSDAKLYLIIYFSGLFGLVFYNFGSSILRAIGDSKRPFYFLVVCSVVNIVLDLLFVIVFHWGVAGVGFATILAQAVSAVLVVRLLLTTDSCIRLDLRKLRIHGYVLRDMVNIGLPNSVQMALVSFSNVFVQGYINYFGTDVTSGWTAYLKLDGLIILPIMSMGQSVMTFVGQNMGAGDIKRAKTGLFTGLIMGEALTLFTALTLAPIADTLVAIFNSKPEVVAVGAQFLRIMMILGVFSCLNQIMASGLRGGGDSVSAMVIMVCSFVFGRQIYLYVMANFISNTMMPIVMGYPFGWITCSIGLVGYYLYAGLGKSKIKARKEIRG